MSKKKILVTLLALIALLTGGYSAWKNNHNALPDYIASGNGRIEAEETQIATKYGGRVIDVNVQEGDFVHKGDVLAQLDTAEQEAQLAGAKAHEAAAQSAVKEVQAEILHRQSDLNLAKTQLDRTQSLVKNNAVSQKLYDQRKAEYASAQAALDATQAKLSSAKDQINIAKAEIDRLQIMIDEATLKSPMNGRVQYRLAEPGEVLGAGARVITLLDLENVYMTIFLPTKTIGQIIIGAQARLILDALPDIVIPASVSFISSEAQFTPRKVETRDEREKLMFRVKIRIPKSLLSKHIDKVRTGLPGVGYILLDQNHQWPENLKVNIPGETQDKTPNDPQQQEPQE